MFRKLITILVICISPACLWAQKTVTHYPNGNKAFKGRMVYAWQEMETKDITDDFNYFNRTNQQRFQNIQQLMHILPEAVFDGKCTFYHPNGKKWSSGKYQFGVKQGKFEYWYANGQLAARQYYKNGMAENHWQIWDSAGHLMASYHYQAIPDSLLTRLIGYMRLAVMNVHSNRNPDIDSVLVSFINRKLRTKVPWAAYMAYEERWDAFKKYFDAHLIQKTFWGGSFEVWRLGKPYMVFAFKNNRPDGIWKLWQDDKLAFQAVFKDDSVVSIKDYQNPEANSTYTRLLKRRAESAQKMRQVLSTVNSVQNNDPNAIDPNLYPSKPKAPKAQTESQKKVFRFVDQHAKFPGGELKMQLFIKNHLQYPKDAIDKNIQGKVVVQFIVTASGKIAPNSIKVIKKVHPLLDAEAVRIIKEMPDWTPAQTNGKPVKSYFIVPLIFKL